MAVKFPFEYEGKTYLGHVFRPVAKVSFQAPITKTWVNIWLIVDTGADFTILPKYLSDDLKISLQDNCLRDTTSGVGGKQSIYLCKKRITVKIGPFVRKVPLAFFSNDGVPPLLGRLGFLETFDTEFLRSRNVVFKE